MRVLARLATGTNILILLALFLIFNFLLIPRFYPVFQTLDTLTSYTPQEAYSLFKAYGAEGRAVYLRTELALDLVYPLVSALLFSLSILYTFQRAFPAQPSLYKAAFLPFGVLLVDILENSLVVIMLLSYPHQLLWAAQAANIFTMLKFLLSPFELIVFIGLSVWLVRAILARLRVPKHASH